MHLTLYTDYTLRVMMYLAVRHADGGISTIDDITRAYSISRSHLTKIVNELANNGFIETTRGRAGGMRLARAPGDISIGALVRMAEKDFAIVQCHVSPAEANCAILRACNLRSGLRRAADAFLRELDGMTLQDAVAAPKLAASLLQVNGSTLQEVAVPLRRIPVRTSGGQPLRASLQRGDKPAAVRRHRRMKDRD